MTEQKLAGVDGIAAVARVPGSMELWSVGPDGSVGGAKWYDNAPWQTYQLSPAGSAATTSGIAAVSRIPTSMELWYVGPDGSVNGAFWYENATWQHYQLSPAGSASTTSGIAAVSRVPGTIELWYVGPDGSVNGAFWYENATWQHYQLSPAGSASTTSGIAAVSRIPGTIELWYVGPDGSVNGAFWYENATWQHYQLSPAGSASTTSGIAAVSRIPGTIELWYVGPDGSVNGAKWYENATWQRYQLAAGGASATTSGIRAVSRISNSLELWYVGGDGSINGAAWYENGSWYLYQIARYGRAVTNSGVAAVSRIPGTLDVWFVGADGFIRGAIWYESPGWQEYTLTQEPMTEYSVVPMFWGPTFPHGTGSPFNSGAPAKTEPFTPDEFVSALRSIAGQTYFSRLHQYGASDVSILAPIVSDDPWPNSDTTYYVATFTADQVVAFVQKHMQEATVPDGTTPIFGVVIPAGSLLDEAALGAHNVFSLNGQNYIWFWMYGSNSIADACHIATHEIVESIGANGGATKELCDDCGKQSPDGSRTPDGLTVETYYDASTGFCVAPVGPGPVPASRLPHIPAVVRR